MKSVYEDHDNWRCWSCPIFHDANDADPWQYHRYIRFEPGVESEWVCAITASAKQNNLTKTNNMSRGTVRTPMKFKVDTPRKIDMIHLKILRLKRKLIWTKPPAANFPGCTPKHYIFPRLDHLEDSMKQPTTTSTTVSLQFCRGWENWCHKFPNKGILYWYPPKKTDMTGWKFLVKMKGFSSQSCYFSGVYLTACLILLLVTLPDLAGGFDILES